MKPLLIAALLAFALLDVLRLHQSPCPALHIIQARTPAMRVRRDGAAWVLEGVKAWENVVPMADSRTRYYAAADRELERTVR